jgi:hypothetical protein
MEPSPRNRDSKEIGYISQTQSGTFHEPLGDLLMPATASANSRVSKLGAPSCRPI